jgi:hypothetical protein
MNAPAVMVNTFSHVLNSLAFASGIGFGEIHTTQIMMMSVARQSSELTQTNNLNKGLTVIGTLAGMSLDLDYLMTQCCAIKLESLDRREKLTSVFDLPKRTISHQLYGASLQVPPRWLQECRWIA